MAVEVSVKWDDSNLQAHFKQAISLIKKNAGTVVIKTARKARADAVKVMARDMNVAPKDFRAAVPLVRMARGSLKATWTISKTDNFIRLIGGGRVMKIPRGHSVGVSTFAVSGGGSAALTLNKGFTIPVNGRSLVMIRIGAGRAAIRPVYAERPATAMQDDRAPLKAWTKTAEAGLAGLGPAIQAALDLTVLSSPIGTSDGGAI